MIDELIRTRRTHKAFGPDPVPRETLLELFELARGVFERLLAARHRCNGAAPGGG